MKSADAMAVDLLGNALLCRMNINTLDRLKIYVLNCETCEHTKKNRFNYISLSLVRSFVRCLVRSITLWNIRLDKNKIFHCQSNETNFNLFWSSVRPENEIFLYRKVCVNIPTSNCIWRDGNNTAPASIEFNFFWNLSKKKSAFHALSSVKTIQHPLHQPISNAVSMRNDNSHRQYFRTFVVLQNCTELYSRAIVVDSTVFFHSSVARIQSQARARTNTWTRELKNFVKCSRCWCRRAMNLDSNETETTKRKGKYQAKECFFFIAILLSLILSFQFLRPMQNFRRRRMTMINDWIHLATCSKHK